MLDWRIFTELAIHLVLNHSAAGFQSALHTVLLKKLDALKLVLYSVR